MDGVIQSTAQRLPDEEPDPAVPYRLLRDAIQASAED
jgi:hypothetical protein